VGNVRWIINITDPRQTKMGDTGGSGHNAGCSPLAELRKGQLRQLASLIKDVDEVCSADDIRPLFNMLEQRVLPWLETVGDSLELWLATLEMKAGVAPYAAPAD
jgi:hypothetical protein